MSQLLVATALGAGWAAVAWLGGRHLFAAPLFARRNVRGDDVPVGVGVLAVLAAVGAQATLAVVDVGRHRHGDAGIGRFLVLALGFAVVGVVDDLAGDHAEKGFAGHLRALRRGRLTTGSLKLLGGGVLALAVVAPTSEDLVHLAVGAAVVALGANTANLFDRAPGRVTKVAVVAAIVLVAVASGGERADLVGVGLVVGGVVGLVAFDLRERLMLGDAGANPVGAVLALGVVASTGLAVQIVVLVVLVALNVAGERVSFSAVIDRVAPLRALDRLGRRPL